MTMFLWSVCVACLTIVGLIFTAVFADPDGRGPLSWSSKFVRVHFPLFCFRCLQTFGGPRAAAAGAAVGNYLLFERNPLGQLFYLAVIGGAYVEFLRAGKRSASQCRGMNGSAA